MLTRKFKNSTIIFLIILFFPKILTSNTLVNEIDGDSSNVITENSGEITINKGITNEQLSIILNKASHNKISISTEFYRKQLKKYGCTTSNTKKRFIYLGESIDFKDEIYNNSNDRLIIHRYQYIFIPEHNYNNKNPTFVLNDSAMSRNKSTGKYTIDPYQNQTVLVTNGKYKVVNRVKNNVVGGLLIYFKYEIERLVNKNPNDTILETITNCQVYDVLVRRPRGIDIHALQSKLKDFGYYKGELTGIVKPQLKDALRRYQDDRKNNIVPRQMKDAIHRNSEEKKRRGETK